jgi:hypothetical protein
VGAEGGAIIGAGIGAGAGGGIGVGIGATGAGRGAVAAIGGASGGAMGGGGAAVGREELDSGGAIAKGSGTAAAGPPDIIIENSIGSIPGGTGIPDASAAATISAGVGSTVPVIQLYPGGPEDVGGAPAGGVGALIEPTDSAGICPNPIPGVDGIASGPTRLGIIAPGGGPAITLGDSVGAGPPTVTGGAMLGVIGIIISRIETNYRNRMSRCQVC